ncbi:hypothetical protein [Roseateles sp.]|jgi:hypothetical protein|uniref:DUF6896 domain-containing protein n=1 Tax=Roseateles sp. TaxID=1971397 RepID=UPI0031D18333
MLESTILTSFALLQHRLLESLRQSQPEFFADKWLLGAPSKSELKLDGEFWEVSKHGVGIMFKRRNPGPELVVDVHTEVEAADRIDAWRLQQFVESTGQSLEFDEAEALLQRHVATGVLVPRVAGGYALGS